MPRKILYLCLDYDGMGCILFNDGLINFITTQSEKKESLRLWLFDFLKYYPEISEQFNVLSVAERINETIQFYWSQRSTDALPKNCKALFNHIARALELRKALLSFLRELSKEYDCVVLLTGSIRQSKKNDLYNEKMFKNGLCAPNFEKLAEEERWIFDQTLFKNAIKDNTKITLLESWFTHLKKITLRTEQSDFYMIDDKSLKELKAHFKKNPKSVLPKMNFLVGHFAWVDLIKNNDCVYTIAIESICCNRSDKIKQIPDQKVEVRKKVVRSEELPGILSYIGAFFSCFLETTSHDKKVSSQTKRAIALKKATDHENAKIFRQLTKF